MTAKEIGDLGEELACRYLIREGYEVIERNYHCHYGEIDIVACDDVHIVFVEVKTRDIGDYRHGSPSDAVNAVKQSRITKSVKHYIAQNRTDKSPRIDVIEILLDFENHKKYIKHIPCAVEDCE